jgi:hypothetical protein
MFGQIKKTAVHRMHGSEKTSPGLALAS